LPKKRRYQFSTKKSRSFPEGKVGKASRTSGASARSGASGVASASGWPTEALQLVDGEWFWDDNNSSQPDGAFVDVGGEPVIDDTEMFGLDATPVGGELFVEMP
jgi:hypothetical protein